MVTDDVKKLLDKIKKKNKKKKTSFYLRLDGEKKVFMQKTSLGLDANLTQAYVIKIGLLTVYIYQIASRL